jgi:YVTN family beta-propeller protein
MRSDINDGSRATSARGFVAICALMLAMGLGLMASRAEAAPFAYITNPGSNSISVIDTATNTVVSTVTVGGFPVGAAVAHDGKHIYVTTEGTPGGVLVIATATNTVVATLTVGNGPALVAVTPDGKHVYVTNYNDGTVSVIDATTNPPSVVATVTVGAFPAGVAVTPDGQHAYVANAGSNNVSVIDTATNTVEARWEISPMGSASPRTGNTSMSPILGDTTLSQ